MKSDQESLPESSYDWEFEPQVHGPSNPILFALQPSSESRLEVVECIDDLRRRNFRSGKYKAPHKIHTTIQFIGSPWELLSAIQERNQSITPAKFYELFTPFVDVCTSYTPSEGMSLRVAGIEPFGSGRVLALAHEPNTEVLTIRDKCRIKITDLLKQCGITPERFMKDYKPFKYFYESKFHTSIFTADQRITRGAFTSLSRPDRIFYGDVQLKGIKTG